MKYSHTYQHFALNTDNCIINIKDVDYSIQANHIFALIVTMR